MIHTIRKIINGHMGASMVKWTTLDPCLGLSGSDLKLYTNFECHDKNSQTFTKHMILQS